MGNCVVVVPPDEVVAIEHCGKFAGIKQPGCHILGCDYNGLCCSYRRIKMRLHEQTTTLETKTKDNVFVKVCVNVQMEPLRKQAFEAIYKLADPYSQIESFVADVIRGQVPQMTLDALFEAKDEIGGAVKERLTKAMHEYGYVIHQALITDLQPDDKVRRAMNEIDTARRNRTAATDKAEADKLMTVKAAEAWAESKYLQGKGVANQRAAIVEGLKTAVMGSDGGSEMDPKNVQELLLITQYFETLEKLSGGSATTIFMPHTVGNLKSISSEIKTGIL